jgi:hypothetical protein
MACTTDKVLHESMSSLSDTKNTDPLESIPKKHTHIVLVFDEISLI